MKKSYAWMMAAIQLSVLTIVFCGTTVLTSCGSDDKYLSDVKIEFDFKGQEALNNILQSVKADIDSADFRDLKSLVDALRNGTVKVTWEGIDSAGVQQVTTDLQSLLDSFFDSENPKNFEKSWNISNLSKTLQLAGNVSMVFEKNVENRYSGKRSYSDSFDIEVNDTLTYKIMFGIEKNTGVSLAGVVNEAHRKLTIEKNGSTVLVVDTNRDLDASINGFNINATQQRMGSVDYKDMKFSLVRTQYNTDSVTSNYVYSKEGREVVAFTCDIDNMNQLYMSGLGLAGMALTGSSKENCQELADSFNAVVNSKLSLLGEEQGLLIIEPVASENMPDVYRPTLILQTYPVGDDSEKYTLKDFLEMMGMSFKDVVNMFIGQ